MAVTLTIEDPPSGARARILGAAADLVAQGGIDALTTRGVAAAAGIQAPTLYRLFGDKDGLLDALAAHQLAAYVAGKTEREPHPDPVEDFKRAWNAHVAFGLGHPAAFAIMQDTARSGGSSSALRAGIAVLRERIRRIARAGLLRVAEDRAVALVHAVGTGTVSTLLASPPEARDPGLAEAALNAVLAALVGDAPGREPSGTVAAAVTLRAGLDDATSLTPGERLLLAELLDRIAG